MTHNKLEYMKLSHNSTHVIGVPYICFVRICQRNQNTYTRVNFGLWVKWTNIFRQPVELLGKRISEVQEVYHYAKQDNTFVLW